MRPGTCSMRMQNDEEEKVVEKLQTARDLNWLSPTTPYRIVHYGTPCDNKLQVDLCLPTCSCKLRSILSLFFVLEEISPVLRGTCPRQVAKRPSKIVRLFESQAQTDLKHASFGFPKELLGAFNASSENVLMRA
jgi:hypothetical protein